MKKLFATYPFLRKRYEDELMLILYINCFGLLRCAHVPYIHMSKGKLRIS